MIKLLNDEATAVRSRILEDPTTSRNPAVSAGRLLQTPEASGTDGDSYWRPVRHLLGYTSERPILDTLSEYLRILRG